MVSIALSQLCDLRAGVHLHFHGPEPTVSCRHSSVMWVVGHTYSPILSLPSRCLDRYQIMLLGDRGTWVCEQLARVVTWIVNGLESNQRFLDRKCDALTITPPPIATVYWPLEANRPTKVQYTV